MRNTHLVSFLLASAFCGGAVSLLPATASAAPPVVGGTTVPAHAYPDAVAVLAENAACSGTLIAPDVVLTAGHCIGVNPVEVIVDTTDYQGSGGDVIGVKSATAYPQWESTYDVGVIVLDRAATVAPRPIAAACEIKSDLVDGDKVRLVGFGLTDEGGSGDNSRLHQALLDVTDAQCTDPQACNHGVSPGGEFEAGGDGTDSCFGDSGGPVYVGGTGSAAALVGVVSRGYGPDGAPCGGGGVYVRADKVVDWIEHTTGRQVTRSTCGKAGPSTETGSAGEDAPGAVSAGGCDAGGGAGALGGMLPGLLVLGGALRTRRTRQKRA